MMAHEGILRTAGTALGLSKKATSEDVRHGLRQRGHKELANEWSGDRAARRASAHRDGRLEQRILEALASPSSVAGQSDGEATSGFATDSELYYMQPQASKSIDYDQKLKDDQPGNQNNTVQEGIMHGLQA